ncbi:hypothetical protein TNCV_2307781 [Trichonephila clavipes]|nr:hypothetical protein TNCV_2307781 [Trichonephila clavipes]
MVIAVRQIRFTSETISYINEQNGKKKCVYLVGTSYKILNHDQYPYFTIDQELKKNFMAVKLSWGHGHEQGVDVVKLQISNIRPLKTHHVEGIMHVKHVKAQNPIVDVVRKLGEWVPAQVSFLSLDMIQIYEVLHQ